MNEMNGLINFEFYRQHKTSIKEESYDTTWQSVLPFGHRVIP